jgi:hypothetical protein
VNAGRDIEVREAALVSMLLKAAFAFLRESSKSQSQENYQIFSPSN